MLAMVLYVSDHLSEMSAVCLTPESVKLAANGAIYIQQTHPFATLQLYGAGHNRRQNEYLYTAPEVREMHFPISREKAFIWSIGKNATYIILKPKEKCSNEQIQWNPDILVFKL